MKSLGAFLRRAFVGAKLCMVALDAAVARQIAIAFDLPRMARIAGFGFACFALRANYRVNMGLR